MDGETLLLTLIALRETAQSEEEYDAAVAALTGEGAAMSIDAEGHQHKGRGPGGGQFTGPGGAGGSKKQEPPATVRKEPKREHRINNQNVNESTFFRLTHPRIVGERPDQPRFHSAERILGEQAILETLIPYGDVEQQWDVRNGGSWFWFTNRNGNQSPFTLSVGEDGYYLSLPQTPEGIRLPEFFLGDEINPHAIEFAVSKAIGVRPSEEAKQAGKELVALHNQRMATLKAEKEAKKQARKSARFSIESTTRHLQGKGIFLAREEAFGSESPGPGWTSAGEGRWVKAEEPPSSRRSRDALRVAVVGGGPGGLFATYLLNQRLPAVDVVIFESGERLGGKIATREFDDGTPYEAGVAELYEYLGPGGKDPLRLLIEKELELPTKDMIGGCVLLKDEVLHDLDAVESVHGKFTRNKIERFHRLMADLMPLEKYANRWQPDKDHPWALDTFLNHLLREMEGDQIATDYVLTAVHSDLATAPHTCNGLNGIKNVLMDNPEYMRLYHIEGGIGKLALALEEAIEATVHLNAPVVEVRKRKEKYRVHYLANGREAHEDFDAVVLALPNHWLSQLRWEHPSLRSAMQRLLAHYDLPAHYLRVSVLFDSRWWDHLRIEGDYWTIDSCGGTAVYDESARWGADEDDGHVLSFLIAGEAALLLCSNDQSDEDVLRHLLRSLPACMAMAEENLIEYSVNRWAGSINAQPGGWSPRELRGQHTPDKKDHPGLFLVGDFLFDSTLNAALMSASTAVELLAEHLGVKAEAGGVAARRLVPEGPTL